jgi:hypothetical protein
MVVRKTIGQPIASICVLLDLRRRKFNPGPYGPIKSPHYTVFREFGTFEQSRVSSKILLYVGEYGSREGIFPMVSQRDDLRREITVSVVDDHPAPVFVKNLQEFRIEQGVGGGQSELSLGFIWKQGPYSARIGGDFTSENWRFRSGFFRRSEWPFFH